MTVFKTVFMFFSQVLAVIGGRVNPLVTLTEMVMISLRFITYILYFISKN